MRVTAHCCVKEDRREVVYDLLARVADTPAATRGWRVLAAVHGPQDAVHTLLHDWAKYRAGLYTVRTDPALGVEYVRLWDHKQGRNPTLREVLKVVRRRAEAADKFSTALYALPGVESVCVSNAAYIHPPSGPQ